MRCSALQSAKPFGQHVHAAAEIPDLLSLRRSCHIYHWTSDNQYVKYRTYSTTAPRAVDTDPECHCESTGACILRVMVRFPHSVDKTDHVDAVSTARTLLAEPSLGPVQALEPAQPLSFDSVRLFCERAAAVRPDHATEHAPAIAAICRQLDGIPLDAVLASTRPAVSTRQPTLAFHPAPNQCESP